MKILQSLKNLTKGERALWLGSVVIIAAAFLLSKSNDGLSLVASLIGVSALIFLAKGDALGQVIIVVFSLFYAAISYTFAYYGEMITYLFMTLPIAVMSVVSWLKNPYSQNQVKINRISKKETAFMFVATAATTAIFYFVLKFFNTANLGFSTLSIATSFLAAYLALRRSALYALAYAANDAVLIVLWTLASAADPSYIPMVVCFAIFLVNDLYGFASWRKMQKQQSAQK